MTSTYGLIKRTIHHEIRFENLQPLRCPRQLPQMLNKWVILYVAACCMHGMPGCQQSVNDVASDESRSTRHTDTGCRERFFGFIERHLEPFRHVEPAMRQSRRPLSVFLRPWNDMRQSGSICDLSSTKQNRNINQGRSMSENPREDTCKTVQNEQMIGSQTPAINLARLWTSRTSGWLPFAFGTFHRPALQTVEPVVSVVCATELSWILRWSHMVMTRRDPNRRIVAPVMRPGRETHPACSLRTIPHTNRNSRLYSRSMRIPPPDKSPISRPNRWNSARKCLQRRITAERLSNWLPAPLGMIIVDWSATLLEMWFGRTRQQATLICDWSTQWFNSQTSVHMTPAPYAPLSQTNDQWE